MPIEIKEISIRANIHPDRQQPEPTNTTAQQDLEQWKDELKKEILAEVKQQMQQQKFER